MPPCVAILAVISVILLVAILEGMVLSIPQDGENIRRRVDVEASRLVSYVPLLPSDPLCVFEIGVRYVKAQAEVLQVLGVLQPRIAMLQHFCSLELGPCVSCRDLAGAGAHTDDRGIPFKHPH